MDVEEFEAEGVPGPRARAPRGGQAARLEVEVKWRIEGAVLRIYFYEGGVEAARLSVRLYKGPRGKALVGRYNGSRRKAEALASILRSWGAGVAARRSGGDWYVALSTRQLLAVDHPEFKKALAEYVKRLEEAGLIGGRQAGRWLDRLSRGPNVVEIAGLKFVLYRGDGVELRWHTTKPERFEAAVKALEGVGLAEGVHFYANRPQGGKAGVIRIAIPDGLKAIAEEAERGNRAAKAALDQLRDVAARYGLAQWLEEALKPL